MMTEPPHDSFVSARNVRNISVPVNYLSFNIFYQNCRGLNTKLPELLQNICSYPDSLDVILLSETWLPPDIPRDCGFPPCYEVFRADRDRQATGLKTGGGVLIAVNNKFKCRRRTDLEYQGCGETCYVEIIFHEFSVLIGNHYFSTSLINDVESFSNYCTFIKEKLLSIEHVVLVGDFNLPGVDWETRDVSGIRDHYVKLRSLCLLEAVSYLNLTQVNVKQLNVDNNLLDLILTNYYEFELSPQVAPLVKIDRFHPPFKLSYSYYSNPNISSNSIRVSESFNFPKGDYLGLFNHFNRFDWSDVLNEPNVNKAASKFTSVVQSGIEKFIPKRNVRKSKLKYPTWFSPETIRLLKHKERCHRKYKKSKSNRHYQEFSQYRWLSKRSISQDECQRDANIQGDFIHNRRKFFTHVSKYTRPKQGIDVIVHNNQTLASDDEISNCFGSYFSSVYQDPSQLPSLNREDHIIPTVSDNLDLPVVSEFDVFRAIKELKPKLSLGADNIPAFIVKGCAPVFAPVLCHIFKKSLAVGIFPSCWKISIVIPIFKSGSKFDVNNYRPVSLLSVFSKVFELIIYKYLYNYIDVYLSPNQHGFRNKKSTTTNLIDFLSYSAPFFESCQQIDAVHFDVSKAFDKVHHKLLLFKLEKYGLSPLLVKWFQSYLQNRLFKVRVKNHHSPLFSTPSGVPQGSNLGPLLFLVFINDIFLSLTCPGLLFADDLKIFLGYNPGSQPLEAPGILQQNINNLVWWYQKNYLSVNASKTKCITFTRKTYYNVSLYYINNVSIRRVAEITDLGFIFDQKLLLNKHISNTVSKCFSRLGLIVKICGRFRSPNIFICLYYLYIRSRVEYCSVLLGKLGITKSNQLERVQRTFVGKLFDKFTPNGYYCYEDICKHYNIQLLSERRKLGALLFLYKNMHGLFKCNSFNENYDKHLNVRRRSCRRQRELFLPPSSTMNPWHFLFTSANSLPDTINIFENNFKLFKSNLERWMESL